MEGDGSVRKRPDLWSYISFSRPNSRSGSLDSLPHPNGSSDPFGGSQRTPKRSRAYTVDEAYTHQSASQRNKILKYAGIGFIVLLVLYFFAPSQYVCMSAPGLYLGTTLLTLSAQPKYLTAVAVRLPQLPLRRRQNAQSLTLLRNRSSNTRS